jgi:hypothetical protein
MIKHLDCFGGAGAVVQFEQHLHSFEEKSEVEIWRDQRVVPVDLCEPLGDNIHRFANCVRVKRIRFGKNDMRELIQESRVGHK